MIDSIAQDPTFKDLLPSNFHHGFSSAAYQIEGGYQADGREPTVWDEELKDKENGNDACNSYYQSQDDIALMTQYGVNAYRFSISWTRIVKGDGTINEAGLAYYDRLVDALIAKNITPWVTIFHWDTPLKAEQEYRSWLDKRICSEFTFFANALFERLGDRVKNWITINEPHIFTVLMGFGMSKPWDDVKHPWIVGHHLILAHAQTVALYREKYQQTQQGQIGITLNSEWAEPIDDSDAAKAASQRHMDVILGWFADPIYLGRRNPTLEAELGDLLPEYSAEEWKIIKESSDFFGLNHYSTYWCTGETFSVKGARADQLLTGTVANTRHRDGKPIGLEGHGGRGWSVPFGFRNLLRHVHKNYTASTGVPIIVTENGFMVKDEAMAPMENVVDDVDRQTFFNGYIKELAEAVRDDGIVIGGYMGWSLLDNLEWVFGYDMRFGVTHVDRENGKFTRTPKDSAFLNKKIFDHLIKD